MISVSIPAFGYHHHTILEHIQLNLETGKTHGVVGLNGAGKTTFFKLLAGLLKNERCAVTFNGTPLLKQQVAFVDTDLFFYPKLTAREFLSVFDSGSDSYNEERLAELFRLPLDGFTEEYSTGMKKKLLLLSQIKQNKLVYILDEPFNGLDLETNKMLEVVIALLNERGKTIFISSHILDPLLHTCHQIHFIKNKTVLKSYGKSEFAQLEEELFGKYRSELQTELRAIL